MHESNRLEKDFVPVDLRETSNYLHPRKYSSNITLNGGLIFLAAICLALIVVGVIVSLLVTGKKLHKISSECLEAACPESWIGFQRKCFYFSEDIKNWTFSQRFCDSHGADLVQVETTQELNFLLRYKGPYDHWIGLSREQGQPWKWINGTEWTSWMFGQMQNTERSMMRKPRKHPCHCQHKWACKDYPQCPKWHCAALRLSSIVLVILIATVIGLTIWANPRLNVCPNNWLQKKGKCYNFLKTFKSWTDSQKSCLKMKSHLLIIQDKAELDFIQSNIQDRIYFWIGLNITHPQKTWIWLDGTPLDLQLSGLSSVLVHLGSYDKLPQTG
ncbi:C-type mannose receptor 2-like isoform X3 [Ailuropoda melanoleuca]|uniref:C-type mannose receptor 2-like isoform X3 n=1 Tax=Ailuropoda melanoleuca TaxID=9646 RepID=UPI0014950255|nr:C-type mannose receptor 2-like isoform X3 [Ailuropoda melanoleuca]